jgi:uncharacterized protein (TIGR02231 family)
MKNILVALLSVFSLTLSAQDEKIIESKITSVTVFLNRAQITREAKTRIEAGKSILRLKGLTSQLDQQSIQVSGKGNFTILGISHEQNYLTELNTPRSLASLRDSIDLTQRQIVLQNSQKEILNREEQMLLANQKIGGNNQNLTAAELKAMADFFRARLSDIINARMKHDQQIKRLNEKLGKLQRQFNEENEMYSRNTSDVLISVSADAVVNTELAVNYVVNNAGWFAIYDLRAINTKSPVQLNYKANVFQSTGEEWKNVRLKLSTANPSLGGLKPDLATWYLDFYRPQTRGYSQLQGRAPGVQIESKRKTEDRDEEELQEVVMAAPAETASQYVSTIQTSLNTEFDISLPYTVSSSNKPTLVEIRNHELKADYNYATAPKLDNDAFLIARATGWEDFSLLPGEANVFFEGTFVGKSFIDPNSIKDTLNVSLGRDKRIVVKREKLKDFSSRKLIGSNQRETRAFEISIRNTKTEAVKITVEDQVPISQNSQIEVAVSDVGGAKYNKDTGKLVWELTLQPNETKKVVYKFEVKYPKDKVVSGLEWENSRR